MKTAAKIVLAFTGVFILALAGLPHHHHSGHGICFTLSLTGEADHIHVAHGHDCDCGDGAQKETDCDLRGIFVMAGRDSDDGCLCDAGVRFHTLYWDLVPDLFSDLYDNGDLAVNSERALYGLAFGGPLNQQFLLGARVLRAPPAFIA